MGATDGASSSCLSRRLTRELEKFTRPDQCRSTHRAPSNELSLIDTIFSKMDRGASTISRLSARKATEGASFNRLSRRETHELWKIRRDEQRTSTHSSQTSSQDEAEEEEEE